MTTTFRTILIGSAAAIVGFPAFAADSIIIPQAEPDSYVRVCDQYGEGFFYLPGTETCFRISGEIEFNIGFSSSDDDAITGYYGYSDDQYTVDTSPELKFDARSETDFGLLRGYIRTDSSKTTGETTGSSDGDPGVDVPVFLRDYFVQLGGFTLGYTASVYEGSPVGLRSQFLAPTDGEMNVGQLDTQYIAYAFTTDRFGFAAAVEDDNNDNAIPDLVGAAEVSVGDFWVYVAGAYDEDYNNSDAGDDDGFSAKVGFSGNIVENVQIRGAYFYASAAVAHAAGGGGIGSAQADGDTNQATNFGGGAEHSGMLGLSYSPTDKLTFALAGQYFHNFYADGTDIETGLDAYQLEFNTFYELVPGLQVLGALAYRDLLDDNNRTFLNPAGALVTVNDQSSQLEGFIEFQRSF